jgi:hypothetical protein
MSTRRAFLGYLGAFAVVAITPPAVAKAARATALDVLATPAVTPAAGFDFAAELGRISDALPDMLGWSTWTPAEGAEKGAPLELVPGDIATAELPGIKDRTFELEVLEVRGYHVRHRLYEVPR